MHDDHDVKQRAPLLYGPNDRWSVWTDRHRSRSRRSTAGAAATHPQDRAWLQGAEWGLAVKWVTARLGRSRSRRLGL